MPEAGEDSASTLSPRPGALGARKNPGFKVFPCKNDHVYDASDETVSTDRQTKTDASLILVDLLNKNRLSRDLRDNITGSLKTSD